MHIITLTSPKGIPVRINPEWMLYWYPATVEGQEHKGTQIVFACAPEDKTFKVQEPTEEVDATILGLD